MAEPQPAPPAQDPDSEPPVILITRVGSWIGAEAAVHFLKRGCIVIGVGSHPERITPLTSALAKLPCSSASRFIACVGPLTSTDVQDEAIAHIKRHGRLTAFVHNVGAFEPRGAGDSQPIEQWEALQLALLESLPMMHRVRALLRRCKSRVVHVASDDESQAGLPPHVALVAIKTAVNMLTAELALVEPTVTSLAVHPGVRLPFATHSSAHPPSTDQLRPAGQLIADLALNADKSMSGQYFMYSEPDFLKPTQS
ncbi:hypothetical protein LPJ63_000605 [Coemansia sp. RSA 2711]|nr:hypothetical protein LPJ63_000605 [Coemansia sp. RSA 2711]KAJ1846925.1 hypothetical protein LPJ70_001798 [Coemansia sp. RSA 2708]KAJ2318603.1 hypothetical protein IWW52_002463 [Coemansia sp. RSA 2704]KAJ2719708.1 hypothetical protein H4R23_004818 [Coemansia sp. Cherry 401B]